MNSKQFEIYWLRLKRYYKNLDRIGKMWYFALGSVLFLLGKLFSFSILDHEFYWQMAEAQQKTIVKNPVSRGSISSSTESLNGVVAVSTNLGTLAIDPSQTGSQVKLLDLLSDAVQNEFCLHQDQETCLKNISNYVRSEEIATNKNLTKADLKKAISDYISAKMNSPIESVSLAPNLGDEAVMKINNLNSSALFFASNNLYVNPTAVKDPQTLAAALSPIIGMKVEEILPKFEIRPKKYLEIIRKMSVTTHDMIVSARDKNKEELDKMVFEVRSKYDNNRQKNMATEQVMLEYAVYPFIKIEDNLVRYYPEGNALGQITGFVDNDGKGQYGIEGYYEKDLQGDSPTQVVRKDSKGRPIRDYVSSGALVFQNGANISLTIDRSIQKEITKRLEIAQKRFSANRVSAIVTDPKTGAIIAMVNYPNYDPNQYTGVHELEPVLYNKYENPFHQLFGMPLFVADSQSGSILHTVDGKLLKLREATDDEKMNSAIQKYKYKNGYGIGNYQNATISALYEPGSVFKAITTAIGIDTGEIKPNDSYYDKNTVSLDTGGRVIKISNSSPSKCGGWHTYLNSLSWSCNVGMINIIEKVGRSLFDTYIHNFGFGTKTNITLDGEVFSQLPPQDKWSRAQFFNMSFGQGISATMIQMASAFNVLANGGKYMQPYIVESITYPNGKKVDTVPLALRRVIKEETSKTITAMLVDGVRSGYASKGGVPGYSVAGKTGTSQIAYRGTYENELYGWAGHTVTSYG